MYCSMGREKLEQKHLNRDCWSGTVDCAKPCTISTNQAPSLHQALRKWVQIGLKLVLCCFGVFMSMVLLCQWAQGTIWVISAGGLTLEGSWSTINPLKRNKYCPIASSVNFTVSFHYMHDEFTGWIIWTHWFIDSGLIITLTLSFHCFIFN